MIMNRLAIFAGMLPAVLLVVSCAEEMPNVIPQPAKIELGAVKAEAAVPESPEGYVLTVLDGNVVVDAVTDAGAFYAEQTLRQLHRQYGDNMPDMRITDWPRFEYRGLQLDVSRHFFDKEIVKKQLRMMASLKLNRFHWHLTDGVGWRLQIDAYPRLTEGEHYTKDDVREVLAYADSLHITVIPEIEMFGHSEEVLAVYPELKCQVDRRSSELCVGSEKTFKFIETVLTEVMELFPSPWIHIGGDEADKEVWNACPVCRERMEKEGLQDTDALQSYGIQRVERFLSEHGRTMIGWDEILDGGLAEGAVVMSWRGEDGGAAAAAMGHDAIMTPDSHCYLNFYQDGPDKEPLAMGSYLPLEQVYDWDPAPEDMPGREHVLGVQGNLWTEYVDVPELIEYQLYPRLFAIAEIGWSQAADNYPAFRERALQRIVQAREDGYCTFDLASERDGRQHPDEVHKHKALGCKVSYETPYNSEKYSGGGDGALTDGLHGGWEFQKGWQGFANSDAVFTVDLGRTTAVREVSARFGQWYTAWICMPVRVEFEASDNGVDFVPLGVEENVIDPKDPAPQFHSFKWEGSARTRFIRVSARINEDKWGWLFADEVMVD